MSDHDIIELPGQPGKYARRILVDAWIAAGSPPANSAGRLYGAQKYFWDGWKARLPGFNPADNPDDETQRLAHVRFGALDIDPTPERIRRLSAAGLYRPYSYEPWHWELRNIRSYAIVRSIPPGGNTTAPASASTPKNRPLEEDMSFICQTPINGHNGDAGWNRWICTPGAGIKRNIDAEEYKLYQQIGYFEFQGGQSPAITNRYTQV